MTGAAIKKSIDYIERELADLVDIYFEQMNVFSAIVGIYGTRALDQHSIYEKVKHSGIAQTRFPDLCRRGCGAKRTPRDCLESKGSKRPWELQSHYDHEGWYVVWRYLVDPTESIDEGKPVIICALPFAYSAALVPEGLKTMRSGEAVKPSIATSWNPPDEIVNQCAEPSEAIPKNESCLGAM